MLDVSAVTLGLLLVSGGQPAIRISGFPPRLTRERAHLDFASRVRLLLVFPNPTTNLPPQRSTPSLSNNYGIFDIQLLKR